jgi:hypothetical protein
MRRVFNETTGVSVGSKVSRAILPTNDAGSTGLMENNTSLAIIGGLAEERGLVVVNEVVPRLSMLCLSPSGRQASANKIVVFVVALIVVASTGGADGDSS